MIYLLFCIHIYRWVRCATGLQVGQ